jgi:hypothetical protein
VTIAPLLAVAVIAGLVYWFPVRAWYRRSDARRIEALRAMSGDTVILTPDYESTLAISVNASAPQVWEALLRVGHATRLPIRTIHPARALVARGRTARREWTWQFELSPLDERRTRLILRDCARTTSPLPSWLFLAIPRAISFISTRKTLLDVKLAAEHSARA